MGRRFTVVAVMPLLLASAAWAQAPATQPRSDSQYTETLYATDQHMGFSIRTTLVRWLGGVDVAKRAGHQGLREGRLVGRSRPAGVSGGACAPSQSDR